MNSNDAVFDCIIRKRKTTMDTKALRQKILDLAIHGKLVPQDPNDEPASVLLERIKAEKERLIKEGKIKRSKKSAKTADTPHYENVPFEVPDNWEWCKLEEICNIKGGKRIPKGKGFSAQRTEHIYLRVTNMKNRTISFDDLKYIDDDVFQEIKNYTISSDDLYLTIAGTIGDVGEIPQEVSGMNLTENAAKLTDIVCDRLYLMYSLLSTNSQEHFSSKFHQVAQPKLSIETASSTLLPLPPFAEQRRIVAEIERWFSLIDIIENDQHDLQTTVKQTKSKILDLAIHGKLVPQDPNDEPASELLKRINPNFTPCDNGHYPFEIPNVWQWCTINDISEVITGSTPSKNNTEYYGGNFPFYKPTDLDTGRHVMKASEYLTEKGKSVSRIIPPKSIAICCIGSIGKTGYIEVEGTTNQQINTIVPKKNLLNSVYGYYTCISDYFVNKLINSSSAITISIINKSKLQSVIFPLPPLAEQQRIVQKIEELFSVLDNIQNTLEV